jgi:hypothetical protein
LEGLEVVEIGKLGKREKGEVRNVNICLVLTESGDNAERWWKRWDVQSRELER